MSSSVTSVNEGFQILAISGQHLKDDEEENRPIKMDNVMKKALEKDVLGYDEEEL